MPRHIKIQKNPVNQRLFVSDAKDFSSVSVSLCKTHLSCHKCSTLSLVLLGACGLLPAGLIGCQFPRCRHHPPLPLLGCGCQGGLQQCGQRGTLPTDHYRAQQTAHQHLRHHPFTALPRTDAQNKPPYAIRQQLSIAADVQWGGATYPTHSLKDDYVQWRS